MARSDVFANAGNPYLVDYAPSLAATKLESLAGRMTDKQDKLAPPPVVTPIFDGDISDFTGGLAGNSMMQDLVDLGQSSVDREAVNIANFATGQSNPNLQAEADARHGVRPELRQRLTDAGSSSINSLADARISFDEGNYLDAAGSAFDAVKTTAGVLPELAVDSLAGSVASGLAGTALTGGIGALPIAAKKVARVGGAIDDISDAVSAAVEAKKAGKKLDVLDKALVATKHGVKRVSQVSLSVASIMQQNEEDYIQENGEPSTALHKLVNAPAAIALMVFDRAIFMKALPSKVGAKASAKASAEYVKEIKNVLSDVPKKYSKQVAKRVYRAGVKAAGVGGAEAVQEYLQSWHSILQSKMDDASIKSALKELLDEGNIDEANYSALVGSMVGGGVKLSTSAPAVVAGAALDTTLGTAGVAARTAKKVVNKGIQVGQDIATKDSLKVLTPEERATLDETIKAEKATADKEVELRETSLTAVSTATSYEDLLSDSHAARIVERIQKDSSITSEDLANPEVLSSVKDKVASELKGEQANIKLKAYGSSKARVVGKVGSKVLNKGAEKAQKLLKAINQEELVQKVKDLGQDSIDAVMSIKSSTARGVVELGLRSGMKSSNVVLKAASNLEVSDLEKVTNVITEKHPELGAKLKKTLDKKVAALKTVGQRNDKLTTKDNLNPALIDIAESPSVTNAQAESVFKHITEVVNGKIGDIESLEVVEAVVAKYKESDSFKGGANKVSMAVLDDRLEKQANAIRKPIRKAAKAKLDAVGETIKSDGIVGYLKDTAAVKKFTEALNSDTVEDFKKKAKDYVSKLPDMPDMPDLETKEGIAKFDKQLEDAYNSIAGKVAAAATTTKETVVGKSKISEEVQKKRDSLHKQLKSTDTSVSALDEDTRESVLGSGSLPALMKKFKAAGYTTSSEVIAALDKYPTLRNSSAIIEEIDKAFPSESDGSLSTESSESAGSDTSNAAVETKAKELYNEHNPIECRI